jgi:rod shape-determining protein MreB
VHLVESPVAAALGANLPIDTPTASLIIDIGGGTTDIAVISMGGTVVSRTLKVAGDRFNEDIIRFVRDEYKLAIGEATAEMAKIAVGSAVPLDERLEIAIRGRDLATGLPREVILKNNHVRAALAKSLRTVLDSVREVIELTPPELAGDMLKQGIYLCGGGALLRGLDELIEKETQVETHIVDEPLTCLARGLGMMVDNFERYGELLDNPLKPLNITLS